MSGELSLLFVQGGREAYSEGGGDEGLSAEAWVDAHEQDDVNLVHDVLAVLQARRGGQHQAAARRKKEMQRSRYQLGDVRRKEQKEVRARIRVYRVSSSYLLQPEALIRESERSTWLVASGWKVMYEAPALAKSAQLDVGLGLG